MHCPLNQDIFENSHLAVGRKSDNLTSNVYTTKIRLAIVKDFKLSKIRSTAPLLKKSYEHLNLCMYICMHYFFVFAAPWA